MVQWDVLLEDSSHGCAPWFLSTIPMDPPSPTCSAFGGLPSLLPDRGIVKTQRLKLSQGVVHIIAPWLQSGPQTIAKLVNTTPISLIMVYDP